MTSRQTIGIGIADGEAVEHVVVGREGSGDIELDLDPSGRLLRVEVVGDQGPCTGIS
ncbi:hypothetical protein [Frigoribacterium salinisoli]